MKRALSLPIFLSFLTATGLLGEDLLTLEGTTYKNIKISSESQESIKLMHDLGISVIKKKSLPFDFLTKHELTIPATTDQSAKEDSTKEKLANFTQKYATFSAKNGTQYKSSQITEVTPSGLKLLTPEGVIRLKFSDLPSAVKAAFDYDPAAATKFDEERTAAAKEAEAKRLKLSNAASQVDSSARRVRFSLSENLGISWVGSAVVLKDRDREVVIAKEGSPLGPARPATNQVAPPNIVYETSKVHETVVVAKLGLVAVFGFPDYRSFRQITKSWSGMIYGIGKFKIRVLDDKGQPEIRAIDAYELDHNKAIQMVAANGIQAFYTGKGTVLEYEQEHGNASGNGSGFAISSDGYIATDAHVVKEATDITVVIQDKQYPAKVVVTDEKNDIAILKVDAETSPLTLIPTKNLKLGDELFTVGYPAAHVMGMNPKLTKGHLNALSGLRDDPHLIQTSVQIEPGNSGGPLCDKDGNVIGLIESTSSILAMIRKLNGALPQNVNFATKSEFLLELAKQVPDLALAPKSLRPADVTAEKWVEDSSFVILTVSKL